MQSSSVSYSALMPYFLSIVLSVSVGPQKLLSVHGLCLVIIGDGDIISLNIYIFIFQCQSQCFAMWLLILWLILRLMLLTSCWVTLPESLCLMPLGVALTAQPLIMYRYLMRCNCFEYCCITLSLSSPLLLFVCLSLCFSLPLYLSFFLRPTTY